MRWLMTVREKEKKQSYLQQIPCPYRAVLVATYDGGLVVPKARTAAIVVVVVPREAVEHLPCRHVYQADCAVERSDQESLAVGA